MKNRLAIVIPAFKHTYFQEALESIANQTNKDFTLYIGDDASPYDLFSIVQKYESRINIKYTCFTSNIGGNDLVSQWNRCVDLVKDEEWVWLFSDDDIMDTTCVESFYHFVETNNSFDVIHFNTITIDKDGLILRNNQKYPQIITTQDFFKGIITGSLGNSFIVDYIFKKSAYEREDKFQNFDLAWSSDDASWIKFSSKTGIYTLEGPRVLWRYSGSNISSIVLNKNIDFRKIQSRKDFICWSLKYLNENGINDLTSNIDKILWISRSCYNLSALNFKEKIRYIWILSDSIQIRRYFVIGLLYLSFKFFKHLK